mmetsp:Transcript_118594/g.187811  ORF Transcript_118594/g.187811 Transcript_118594/m.187811 type:complete len:136 (-) Transcript_118594:14-421(-)
MPSSALEDAILKERKWTAIWSRDYLAKKRAGTLPEPSPWSIGPWRRPRRLGQAGNSTMNASTPVRHVVESNSSPALMAVAKSEENRGSAKPSLPDPIRLKMTTSHMTSEMKRNFNLSASVLGERFSPSVPRFKAA